MGIGTYGFCGNARGAAGLKCVLSADVCEHRLRTGKKMFPKMDMGVMKVVDFEVGPDITATARASFDAAPHGFFLLITTTCLGFTTANRLNNILPKQLREGYWMLPRIIYIFLALDVGSLIPAGFIENSPMLVDEDESNGPTPWTMSRDRLIQAGFHIQVRKRLCMSTTGGSNKRRRAGILFWRAPSGEPPECRTIYV